MNKNNKPKTLNTFEQLGEVLQPAKEITIKSFVGAPPGDQEASYMTKDDWDKYHKEVAELKKNGTYGEPTETTFVMTPVEGFSDYKGGLSDWGILIPSASISKPTEAQNRPQVGDVYSKSVEPTPWNPTGIEHWEVKSITPVNDEPHTIYLDPMTDEQRELQYGAVVDPAPAKRVSLLVKQKRRY